MSTHKYFETSDNILRFLRIENTCSKLQVKLKVDPSNVLKNNEDKMNFKKSNKSYQHEI